MDRGGTAFRRFVTRIPVRVARLVAGVALAFAASAFTPAHTAEPLGVWQAVRVNQQALPMTDRVVGQDGLTHAVRLHSMTIRMLPKGRFQAALKYRRAILTKGERVETQPLLNDTWIGTYTQTGSRMQFVPEQRGAQQIQPFSGQAAGRRITVGFDYYIAARKHYVLDLDKNDKIF
jgi:hypothetical protein